MGFRNDIIGGAAALIRAAIKSPNYVTGTSGWTVNKDGSAEFQNVIIRGTINAGSFTGTTFIINSSGIFFYAGTPALGNLVASIATTAGTDSFGNTYPSGEAIGLNGSGQIQLQPNVNQAFDITTAITGVFTAMAQYYTGDVNQMMPGMFGGVLLGSGTATKMTSAWHSPFGTQGAAIVLEAQNDAGTDNPVLTFGTVSMPDGMTMVFVPIMTLTPFALVLYSAGGSQVAVTKTSGSGTIPIPVGVTTAKAEVWGAGGGGGGSITSSGATNGGAGASSTLTGTSVTVTAHGGSGGTAANGNTPGTGGAAGTGSTNTTHHDGGSGAAGIHNAGTNPGGGGGGSGGTSSAGNAAGTPPSGAVAVSGGGPGGNGGSGAANGSAPSSGPGGGGGGASQTVGMPGSGAGGGGGGGGEYAQEPSLAVTGGGTVSYSVGAAGSAGTGAFNGGAGKAGQVRLTYTNGTPTVGLSVNFGGSAITDQFGNSIPTGLNTTAKITTSGGEAITGGSTIDTLHVTSTSALNGTVTAPDGSTLASNGIHVATTLWGNAGTLAVGDNTTLASGKTVTADNLTANTKVTLPDSETWGISGLASAGGFTGKPPIVQTSVTPVTITQATSTTIASVTVPANDAQTGTFYKVSLIGFGTWGSTAQALTFSFNIGSTSLGSVNITSTAFPASQSLRWEMDAYFEVVTSGASGTITAGVVGVLAEAGVSLTTSTAVSLAGGATGNTAMNTTISNTLSVLANWASTTGAPTITSKGFVVERLGP